MLEADQNEAAERNSLHIIMMVFGSPRPLAPATISYSRVKEGLLHRCKQGHTEYQQCEGHVLVCLFLTTPLVRLGLTENQYQGIAKNFKKESAEI